MSRIKKLEDFYQEQLKGHKIDNVSDFIQSILDVDITKGKYARFLIEAFLNDKFLEEDLIGGVDSTIGQAISLFDKHKNKLPINERSVYALDKETGKVLYQSPGDLWNSVKQFQGELSGKELKREEQEKIYHETEFVYKDEETGFQIVSPLTKESAQWWGKGTRWCTSAENNNMFEHYANISPLFILLIPNHNNHHERKLQLWKDDNDIQFMDEADKEVNIYGISNIFLLKYFQEDFLYAIKDSDPDYQVNYQANKKKSLIYYQLKNEKILEILKLFNDDNVNDIKEKFMDLIKISKTYLNFLPYIKHVLDIKINLFDCMIKDINKISHKKIINFIIKSMIDIDDNNIFFEKLNDKYKTLDVSVYAIRKSTQNFTYLPDKYTKNIFFERFDRQLQKEKYIIYKELLINNYNIFQHISNRYKTKELCELAIKQDREILQYIPNKYRTKELCEMAVRKNGENIKYVPHKYKTKELYEIAISNKPLLIEEYPFKIDTDFICNIINIKNVYHIIQYIKENNLINKEAIHKIFTIIKTFNYQEKLNIYNNIFNDEDNNFKLDITLQEMICQIDVNYIFLFSKDEFFWKIISNNIKEIELSKNIISTFRNNQNDFNKIIEILNSNNIYPDINIFSISDDMWNKLNYKENLKEKIDIERKNIFSSCVNDRLINPGCNII